jgi:CrcB protein
VSATVVVLGALGAWARAELTWALARRRAPAAAVRRATWVVNLAGAAALGLVLGAAPARGGWLTDALGVGFLGGFTTFSTWMVDSLRPAPDGSVTPRPWAVGANVGGMLAVGVTAAWLGLWLGARVG